MATSTDLTFFAECPRCQAPGPHHAEYREYQPPSEDYEVLCTEQLVNWFGDMVRQWPVDWIGDPAEPEHTRYECTQCHHEWRQ